ncbi:MAG: hypothetical protein LBR72_06115 [Oscillospiraceae bacterium]|jgi:hypothetical protein|nr:hypothetical protein [Oscillospiraceae bacterium]
MDFGFRRAKQTARDVELPLPSYGGVRYVPAPERVSKLLRLARERNPANALPDKLCRIGTALFCVLAALSLLFWGGLFRNATMVLRTGGILLIFPALPSVTALIIRQALGLASPLHKFHSPVLTLGADRLILERRRHMLFRGKHSPTVRREFLYSRIAGLEYDRAAKTLRLLSAYTPGETAFEITMFYDQPEHIIREIETRTQQFVRPAMRGDDYADLRDLPGLKREAHTPRIAGFCVLLLTLASLVTALGIRGYAAKHPYRPYPATEVFYLTGDFGVGDTVTLDGCDITLNSVAKAGSDERGVCYQIVVEFKNNNGSDIRLRAGETEGINNVAFSGLTLNGASVAIDSTRIPPGYVGVDMPLPSRLQAGRTAAVNFFVWAPPGVTGFEMRVSSDCWPPADILRDVVYTGETVTVAGQTLKSNEVRFTMDLSAMPEAND